MTNRSGNQLTVIIVTLGRPKAVERCLMHLLRQTTPPHQIIVVDGDDEESARPIAGTFQDVLYIHNPDGFGRMTASRNIGLLHATGDIVAYIDDDAYVRPRFVDAIVEPYEDMRVAAVGGRTHNDIVGEASRGVDAIGLFSRNGGVIGNFAADPGRIVEVDHLIGCNMSFRRSVLCELGGFHEYYPGFCSTYEEADLCIRIKKLGYRIVFNPHAAVDHEGAPRTVGTRFNLPYMFRVSRNHSTMIVRNYGLLSIMTCRYVVVSIGRIGYQSARKMAGAALRFLVTASGLICGLVGGIPQRLRQGRGLRRQDAIGREISSKLQREVPSAQQTDPA
jgi:GT2 family glycosyltransferase